ncbi:MAG TPA: DASS family sodium-coupled anion symporter [Candidatus Acidoferrales bacterium]
MLPTMPSNPTPSHLSLRWGAVLAAAGVVLAFPVPVGLDPRGWYLLAIFAGTVVGLITQPAPMGVMVILGLTVAAATKTVTVQNAFSAFANPVVWLIIAAFLFARAVVLTGLGRRIALQFVRWFGSSSLRLGYALAGADFLVSPVIPSDTARAGGIIFPIARSLAESYDSRPGETAQRLGAYLMQCAYHVGCTTAAVFLTSMAANPLAAEFAKKFAGVEITWGMWIQASCVPAAISLAVLPWLIYRLDRPQLEHTPEAVDLARRELAAMGRTSAAEKKLVGVLLLVITAWAAQPAHGLHPAVVALAGISVIVLAGIIRWDDVIEERRAWDAFIWFGGLIMMAEGLNTTGVIAAFTGALSGRLEGMAWMPALVVLVLAYVYVHYGFASMTAHITALYPAFLLLAVANGAPALVAALALAFFSNLNASLTHYGTGPAPIFFGSGYVKQTTWWRVGFVVVLFNLLVWLGVGLLWWRILGLY